MGSPLPGSQQHDQDAAYGPVSGAYFTLSGRIVKGNKINLLWYFLFNI